MNSGGDAANRANANNPRSRKFKDKPDLLPEQQQPSSSADQNNPVTVVNQNITVQNITIHNMNFAEGQQQQ